MAFDPSAPLEALSGRAFLVSSPDDGSPGWAYFLCASPQPDAASFAALWNGANGTLLFTNHAIVPADADQLTQQLQQHLNPPTSDQATWHCIAWADDPYALTDLNWMETMQTAPGVFSLVQPWRAAWGGLGLELDENLTVQLGMPGDASVLMVAAVPHEVSLLHLTIGGVEQMLGYSIDGFQIPVRLAGQGMGSLRIALGLDPSMLFGAFRCGFLYRDAANLMFYPMVQGVPCTRDNLWPFDIWLNPIRPLDGTCTRFSLDQAGRLINPGFQTGSGQPLDAPYFSGPTGEPLTLHPFDPGPTAPDAIAGGFAFSVAPASAVPPAGRVGIGTTAFYLSPCGLYSAGEGERRLMPGVFGEEFLLLGPGDLLEFVANCPSDARAPTPAPGIAVDTDLLTTDVTTSWVRVQPAPAGTPAYFGQPSASSFFGATAGEPLPGALDVQLAAFTGLTLPFPLVPYGGVYLPVPTDTEGAYLPPFAGDPNLLLQLEARVLANIRHDILARAPRGPVFMPKGAEAPDPKLGQAASAQALLLDLNADGTASALTLAVSPQYTDSAGTIRPALALRFDADADGALWPGIGNLLTRDQLFLVVSSVPPGMPAFMSNELDLAGFNLQFDIGDAGGAVLVFKFNDRQTLADLAAKPSAWAEADTFNVDPTTISQRLCERLNQARTQALNDPIGPFAALNAIAGDAEWTGVIGFDVQIDGNGMPPDLQVLLGGIQGDLRAHHLGVETNRITVGAGNRLMLTNSSLFGLIDYIAPAATSASVPDCDYEVQILLIEFSNSQIVHAEVTIGVTLGKLFGRQVWLRSPTGPPDTLVIPGKTQTVDGIFTVSFTTTQPAYLDFRDPSLPAATTSAPVRVLQTVAITKASLLQVSSGPASGGATPAGPAPTQVTCRLLMDGELIFAADPFGRKIDLFSYGNTTGGMAFSGLAVEIAFELDPRLGSMVPGSKSVQLIEQQIQGNPDSSRIRRNSFLDCLPTQFSQIVVADALTASARTASPVHVLQLESQKAAGSASPAYTTSAPAYGLEYDIHLGSLGSLSDDHAGIAAKVVLGWGPSDASADNDGAGLMVQLPQLGGGVAGFSLQGLLTTRFGDANLLQTNMADGSDVFALLFNNVQLAFLGYNYPPKTLVDFLVFGGGPSGSDRKTSNIAWFLSATKAAS